MYSDMHEYADAIVEVPPGSMQAEVVVPLGNPRRPPSWLSAWQVVVMACPAAILAGAVEHIGPIGPTSAAVWVALNWWLH